MSDSELREKPCKKCHQVKSVEEFARNRMRRDGYAKWCRTCFNNFNRQSYGKNLELSRHRARVNSKQRRKQKTNRISEYLSTHPCVDCGIKDPIVLEFDHRSDAVKTCDVMEMVRRDFAWETIEQEIAKCEVRCANCHRRKDSHYFRSLAALYPYCAWCSRAVSFRKTLDDNLPRATVDHIIPRSKGGSDAAENLCLSCSECNEARRDRELTTAEVVIPRAWQSRMVEVAQSRGVRAWK